MRARKAKVPANQFLSARSVSLWWPRCETAPRPVGARVLPSRSDEKRGEIRQLEHDLRDTVHLGELEVFWNDLVLKSVAAKSIKSLFEK